MFYFYTCGNRLSDESRKILISAHSYIGKVLENKLLEKDIDRKTLDSLLNIGAIRIKDKRVLLNFPVFKAKDAIILNKIGKKLGKKLSEYIIKSDIDISWFGGNNVGLLRLFILGSYILDLDTVERLGCSHRNNINETLLFAREKSKVYNKLEKELWMSTRSGKIGNYVFYTFGSPNFGVSSERFALPDALQRKSILQNDKWGYQLETVYLGKQIQVSKILLDMGYVVNGKLTIPFVFKKDKIKIKKLAKKFGPIIDDSMKGINKELIKLSAYSYANHQDLFIEVYHWIFGNAIKFMIERGYMDPNGAKYIKWVERVR